MGYFTKFKQIQYDLTKYYDTTSQIVNVTDLTTRVNLKISDASLSEMTQKYVIGDGETPESISFKLYGTVDYYWTILYINKIADFQGEWPLSDAALEAFCTKKYTDVYATHHYEKMPEMIPMDYDFLALHYGPNEMTEVTNIQYEENLNNFKRFILVIKPTLIKTFYDTYNLRLA